MSTVTPAYLDQRLAAAKRCSRELWKGFVDELIKSQRGAIDNYFENAIDAWTNIEFVTVAMDGRANGIQGENVNLASVRMLPWARAHLNPTGQALIISTVAGMAYFIVADKTILSMARKHSFDDAPDHLKNTSFH
ncbi:hypothetical protein CFC21_109734 [Triticum aestivum]|uniref:Uncharacterized protein n=3 Tax=Triticinae TaxID=1648030 RepID=A0A9R1NAE9_WHEAT|nr:hypothetical protein CFC21_107263 [Triticum aestivum]KAF7109486.1 hypothetical protein CFC21_109734 [Triticum aestivum]